MSNYVLSNQKQSIQTTDYTFYSGDKVKLRNLNEAEKIAIRVFGKKAITDEYKAALKRMSDKVFTINGFLSWKDEKGEHSCCSFIEDYDRVPGSQTTRYSILPEMMMPAFSVSNDSIPDIFGSMTY